MRRPELSGLCFEVVTPIGQPLKIESSQVNSRIRPPVYLRLAEFSRWDVIGEKHGHVGRNREI